MIFLFKKSSLRAVFQKFWSTAKGIDLLIIDEAQNIPGIGHGLKILVDHCQSVQVIATGSSAFEIAQQISEPLVGRQIVLKMFPILQEELSWISTPREMKDRLDEHLIFGSYPEVLMKKTRSEKIEYLRDLVGSYLFKDLLHLANLRSPQILLSLTKLLAFQIGSEVSVNELARSLGIDSKTVSRYLDLLEKSFIIYSQGSYSNNLRSTISKKRKYFFLDNGVRNAIISQFNGMSDRSDCGALFENFVIMERIKRNATIKDHVYSYFWRNYLQEEIDYVEEKDGAIAAFEMKYSEHAKTKPKGFEKEYPEAPISIIHRENYLNFVLFPKVEMPTNG